MLRILTCNAEERLSRDRILGPCETVEPCECLERALVRVVVLIRIGVNLTSSFLNQRNISKGGSASVRIRHMYT